MSESTLVETLEVINVLQSLCAHNASGDIHYDLNSESIKTARFRFLGLESNALCIDQPNNIDEEVNLQSGQSITVYFTHGNDRWSFESRIQKLRTIIRLNDKKRLVGMALALPSELRIQQRRRDYRVSIASLGNRCRLTPESLDWPNACDLDSKAIPCSIRDISARGMALVVHPDPSTAGQRGTRFFVEFELGNESGVRVSLAELCHAKTIGADRKQRWGMRLVPVPGIDFEELKADLAHYVAEVQRTKLRRKR